MLESGGADPNADGVLGNLPTIVNPSNGRVIGTPPVTGEYDGRNGDEVEAVRVNIDTPPANQTENSGDPATFSVVASGDSTTSFTTGTPNYNTPGNANAGLQYQWQRNGTDIDGTTDGGVYSGFNTNTLSISNVSGLSGNVYNVIVTHTDNVCANEQASATLTVNAFADVGVTKTLTNTSPYQTGDTVTYTLIVSNSGPDTANNVVVTDTPTNLTIQTISAPCAGGFPCTIPSIASGTPANDVAITVTATIDGGGAFDNAASVSADETDNNAANDTDNDGAVAAAVADVGITKTLTNTSPYQTGDTVTYTLVVSNSGPDTANNVVVTDTPSNLTIQTISAPCAGGFPCTIPSIASGSPANDVAITVTATVDGAGAFDNAASVSADEIDNNAANDTDNDGAVAAGLADVGVTKTLTDTSPYQTGDTVTYTLIVSNTGPDTANNVVVTDTPTNLTIQTISAPCAGGFPCTIPSIASGTPANDVAITVTATIDGGGAFDNAASVSADETDNNAANDTDNDGAVAAAVADVGITINLNKYESLSNRRYRYLYLSSK